MLLMSWLRATGLLASGTREGRMYYRVDYVFAVMGAGFLIGLFTGRWSLRFTAACMAQAYFNTVIVLLALSSISLTFRLTLGYGPAWTGAIGDLSGLLYGLLFGIAVRRDDRRALLLDRAVLSALAISIAVTFASAGLGKAFSMAPMHDFFAQSGYPDAFLRFIIVAEVLGALAMLIPSAVPAALAGLGIDMFGAVLTHIHNGDPLNDSTGAIAMLLRLGIFSVLWERKRGAVTATLRGPLLRVAAAALLCLLLAGAGGLLIRHRDQARVPVAAVLQR
jgi:uncharacterized membrane protein YphA (DoxX/SURF4 family)